MDKIHKENVKQGRDKYKTLREVRKGERKKMENSNYSRGWDLAKCLERLAVNAKVATVLGSIPASSDTVESEWRQMKQCWIKYIKIKNPQKSPFKKIIHILSLVFERSLSLLLRDLDLFEKQLFPVTT